MIKEQEILKVFNQLTDTSFIQFAFEGNDVTVKAIDHASKISLSTQVYTGASYIPKSVRNSVAGNTPLLKANIPTFLSIDEQNFSISLNFLGNLEGINAATFRFIVEEFSFLADEWRHYLDDLDNNDRVYIYQKR